MRHATIEPRRFTRPAPRGLALLLVLGVVAVASILSWSMLSSASMRAQVEATTADALDAQYLAESGVSHALYYLMNPAKSSVATRQGTYNAYYPGQTGITMWGDARGTVDTSVTNTGDGQFSIASSTTVNGIKRTLIADAAYSYDRYAVTHALALNNAALNLFAVPSNLTVNGPVVLRGYTLGSTSSWSNAGPMTAAGANVTPTWAQLTLAVETGTATKKVAKKGTDRAYTYDGKDYTAEAIVGGTVLNGLTTSDPTLNPINVWYSDGDVTMNNVTFTGTIVVRNTAKLTVTGLNVVASKAADMPAILADAIDMKQGSVASRLTVTGVVWVDNTITNSGPGTSTGWLTIQGALLFGGNAPAIAATMKSPISVTYAPSAAKIPALSTVRTVNGLAVRGWRQGT